MYLCLPNSSVKYDLFFFFFCDGKKVKMDGLVTLREKRVSTFSPFLKRDSFDWVSSLFQMFWSVNTKGVLWLSDRLWEVVQREWLISGDTLFGESTCVCIRFVVEWWNDFNLTWISNGLQSLFRDCSFCLGFSISFFPSVFYFFGMSLDLFKVSLI